MFAEPPPLADKTIVFFEHEVFKVVVMVTMTTTLNTSCSKNT